jgi:hypothetical protein
MLPLAIALVFVGVVFLFIIPWVGIPVGIVGLILMGVYFVAAGKRATTDTH